MDGLVAVGSDEAAASPAPREHTIIDLPGYEVAGGNIEVMLSQTDHDLLACLLEQPGKVVSYEELMQRVGCSTAASLRIRVHRLRAKLANAGLDLTIRTVWRVGYKVNRPLNAD